MLDVMLHVAYNGASREPLGKYLPVMLDFTTVLVERHSLRCGRNNLGNLYILGISGQYEESERKAQLKGPRRLYSKQRLPSYMSRSLFLGYNVPPWRETARPEIHG